MKIIQARAADAEQLTRIALAAKRYWGYPEAWIESWRSLLTITPGFIKANETWIADETELKANANKRKRDTWIKEVSIEEDTRTLEKVNEKREKQGKRPLKPQGTKTEVKRVLQSPVRAHSAA